MHRNSGVYGLRKDLVFSQVFYIATLLDPFPLLHLRGSCGLSGSGASTVCVCVCVCVSVSVSVRVCVCVPSTAAQNVCPQFTLPNSTHIDIMDGSFGSVAVVTCNPGYVFQGAIYTCSLLTGSFSWSGSGVCQSEMTGSWLLMRQNGLLTHTLHVHLTSADEIANSLKDFFLSVLFPPPPSLSRPLHLLQLSQATDQHTDTHTRTRERAHTDTNTHQH